MGRTGARGGAYSYLCGALSYPDEIGFLGLPVEIDDLGDVP